MGFRSTFVTDDYSIEWPDWFRKRYADTIHFPEKGGPISAKHECKIYYSWADLTEDIRQVLLEDDGWRKPLEQRDNFPFRVLFLHECGGSSRADIYLNRIVWSEPDIWVVVPYVTHSYCNGCSEPVEVR